MDYAIGFERERHDEIERKLHGFFDDPAVELMESTLFVPAHYPYLYLWLLCQELDPEYIEIIE